MELGLTNKIAVVGASSKGLGKAIALGLAYEGARVTICARDSQVLEQTADEIREKTDTEVLAVPTDVSQPEQVERLISTTIGHFGGIDILVNNAGGPRAGRFDDLSAKDYQDAVNLNLMSTINLCRAVVPWMQKRGGGRIINLTSVSVKQPVDGLMLSNMARTGVIGFAKTLATELAPDKILVNNVCPGIIFTDRIKQLATVRAEESGITYDQALENMTANIPLGRIGDPEEFANLVVFLASEKSSYITGTTIQVDGGMVRSLL
ncbi:SDR family oxidoreductase [Candidatus Poribacteria bacterium]|nr:SDR family oxidoreductase [Candidatus Poribacteria bacterium]MYF54534.1 SDR family oxidoreductase [Candidatus Poribacteria bacterium]MYI93488.1 SDR family oxidoreductase [Candidatus Poribacteria bacterium]